MLLALTLAVLPQWGAPQPLDPADFASSSGSYRLHVVPATRFGRGPASYDFFQGEQLLWSQDLDFALYEVAVSDEGYIAGYARRDADEGAGTFIVSLIEPGGEVVLEEHTKRTGSKFPHTEHNPRALGLVPDFEHDRFFVRVADKDVNRGIQEWWSYQLPDGERLKTLKPELKMMGPPAAGPYVSLRLSHARALPSTGLFLTHWWRSYFRGSHRKQGAAFTLMDDTGDVVWELDLFADYNNDEDANGFQYRGKDMILSTSANGIFELRFVEAGQRVRFQATPDAGAPTRWRVQELARSSYVGKPKSASPLEPTEVALPITSKVSLQRASSETSSLLANSRAWDFDGKSGFLVIRATDGGGFSRERLDADGELVSSNAFDPIPEDPEGGLVGWQGLGKDQWLVSRTTYGEDEKRLYYALADGATGELFELTALVEADSAGVPFEIEQAALLPNGNLVALGTYRFEYTMHDALFALDGAGHVLWAVHEDYEDKTKLFSPEAVTVTTGGLAAVLENVSNRIQVYSKEGEFVRSLDLESLWAAEPSYPSEIRADNLGGVLVHDFSGKTALWHMDIKGEVCVPITPHFEDGRTSSDLNSHARFDANGTLWTDDGFTLHRLDTTGLVVETLGAALDRKQLYEPGPVGFLPDGRVCILDKRTGALHLWDESGKLLFVGDSEPGDESEVAWYHNFAVDSTGSIWAMVDGRRYLGWGARGKRLGIRDFSGIVTFVPGSEHYWVWGKGTGASLHDREGRLIADVQRTPSGRWIRGIGAFSISDEGFVYLAEEKPFLAEPSSPLHMIQCSTEGDVLGAWPLDGSNSNDRPHYAGSHWRIPDFYKPVVLRTPGGGRPNEWLSLTGPGSEPAASHGLSKDGDALLSLDTESLILFRRDLPALQDE